VLGRDAGWRRRRGWWLERGSRAVAQAWFVRERGIARRSMASSRVELMEGRAWLSDQVFGLALGTGRWREGSVRVRTGLERTGRSSR
jgi:hypothetical protein